ncbi:MAG: transcriptional repressor LexA [Armatimonadetes bacterium]|nr:transcriptional repressor LexA [Armatimonadota bacterium]
MSRSSELTPRRRQILDFIATTTRKRGYPPTVREIGAHVGLSSSSSVHFHLRWLQENGYLERDGSLTRALRVAESSDESPQAASSFVPLVGRVAAGEPIFASENIEQLVPAPTALFGEGDLFMLQVQGDSMIEAGILDGDLVVVNQQPTAENGEIVVALIGDEATVKYLHRRDGRIELRPANSAMEPIVADDVQIIGRVRGVIRSMR